MICGGEELRPDDCAPWELADSAGNVRVLWELPASAKTDLESDTPALRPDVSRPSSPLKYSHPILIGCFLRRRSAGVWGSCTFFFTSHISHITYHASLVWRTHDVGLNSLLYFLYTVSRSCMILPHSRVLIRSSRFFNKPH